MQVDINVNHRKDRRIIPIEILENLPSKLNTSRQHESYFGKLTITFERYNQAPCLPGTFRYH